MSTNLITGYGGKAHITAEGDGAVNAALFGSGRYVLEVGDQFAYELVSNNLIKVKSGYAIDQGRKIELALNDYEELTIDNGLQGVKRCDLVVITYKKNIVTGIETATMNIIKGTSGNDYTDPEYTVGDILSGETKDDFPLYRIKLNGLSVESVEPMFETMKPVGTMDVEDNTVSFKEASALGTLTSGEKLNIAFGKIALAIRGYIGHIAKNATASVLGHVKLSSSTSVTDSTGLALPATEKNATIDGTLANQISKKAPTSHASTGTTYGIGNASNYGHVKLSDVYTSLVGAAANAIGASQSALYNAYKALNDKFAKYLPLAGGTMTGALKTSGNIVFTDTGCIANTDNSKPIWISAAGKTVSALGTQGTFRFHYDYLQPGKDNVMTNGSANYRWKQFYGGTSSISTSDRNLKDNITPLTELHKRFFMKLIPCSFTFKDGESGRIHIGFIAQDVEAAMEELGMTALDFAGLCKDVKTKVVVKKRTAVDDDGNPLLDEEGNIIEHDIDYEVPDLDEDGNEQYIYSLRYDEFIAIITHVVQDNMNRLDALEAAVEKLQAAVGV